MFVHIYYLFWSQSPAQVQFKVQLLQIWGSLPHVGTCDNQGLGWTKLARRLARAQRRQILTMQTQVGGRYTHTIHIHIKHTHNSTIFICINQYKIQSNMVKMLFDDLNNSLFFSGEPASQPQPTSHITNLQDVSLRCVSVYHVLL